MVPILPANQCSVSQTSLHWSPRLDEVFQSYETPLFFLTICTLHRQKIVNLEKAHDAFRGYGQRAIESNIAVGRYVMMPDHVHLFVQGDAKFELQKWVN